MKILTPLLALFLSVQCSCAKSLEGSRPNILLIITDDQGMGDLSCMGNPILKTPHLDAFYKKSTRFSDFQVSPTCAPTRAALMSGRRPFEVGVSHTIKQREKLALDVVTFPQALQKAGYRTGLFGKWHLGDEEGYLPQERGFDEVLMHGGGGIGQGIFGDFVQNETNTYFDNVLLHNDRVVKTEGFCTDVFFDAAEAWVEQELKSEDPFFCYISLNAPHAPMFAPESSKKSFYDLGFDERTVGRYAMVENIDDNVGELMSKMEAWGALENTLVIFMTDNGMAMRPFARQGEKKKTPAFNAGLRGGKNSSYEGGTHVPFFMQWKGTLEEGKEINVLSAHLDLYKTFCALAGAEIPESRVPPMGRSLLPIIESPEKAWNDRQLFVHIGRWQAGERELHKYKGCAVRTQKWRLVNNKELFDIENDPGEKKNVAAEHPEKVKELSTAYDAWWDATEPLLIHEGLPSIKKGEFHLQRLYKQQSVEGEIPLYQLGVTD